MEALQFVVQLQDAVSGPANSAAASLAGIGTAAGRAGAAERGAASAARQMGAAEAAAAGQARALAAAQARVASSSEAAAGKMRGLGKVLEFAGVPFASKFNQGAEILEQIGPAGLAAGAAIGAVAVAALASVAALGLFAAASIKIFAIADKANLIGKAFEKLKSKATGIFERVNVAPIASAIERLSGLFDTNTASGEAMAHVIGRVFSAVAELTAKLIDLGRPVFEGLIIGALQAYIAFLRLKNSGLGEAITSILAVIMPSADQLKQFGQALAYAAAVGAVAFGAGIASAVAVVSALVSVVSFLASGVQSLLQWFGVIPSAASAVEESLLAMADGATASLGGLVSSAASIASDFVGGLASGIAAGVGRVVDAARSLGSAAAGAVKSALGIASPSRVMMQFGGYTAEGFAMGLEASTPDVASSARAMAAAPAAAALPAAAPRGGNIGSRSVSVGNVTITITGVQGADQILDRLPAALADAFEVVAESMGVPTYA